MRKELVLDATPLIHLTRIGFWKYAGSYLLLTTPLVVKELSLDRQFPETLALKAMLSSKQLRVVTPHSVHPQVAGLSAADLSIIQLARQQKAIAVIDDEAASLFAQTSNVSTVHSSTLLVHAVKTKKIGEQEAVELVNQMIEGGWHCDTQTYAAILASIRNAASSHHTERALK